MCDFLYNEKGQMICTQSGKEIVHFEVNGFFCNERCVTPKNEESKKLSNVDILINQINDYASKNYAIFKGD